MNPRQAVRLLLVEADRPVHAAVRRLIERQKLPYVLETAASQQEAISRLRHAAVGGMCEGHTPPPRCDAVLLDCTNGNGRRWEIFEQPERSPVILLVDRRSNDAAIRAARWGACPCPVDTADESSWRLLPAVVDHLIAWKRRLAKLRESEARQRLGKLAHLERLSTINGMAAGLAHELKQPLSAIADYARACRHQARNLKGENRDEVIDFVSRIAEQADRAGEIIRRLREFGRPADCRRSAVDLNDLVRELMVLLEVAARSHGVRLELALGRRLPKVTIDRIQIQQVITNLVHNATEAVGAVPQQRRVVTIRTSLSGENELEVAVEDKGTGLEEENLERVFEPFYTRKAEGMGLGLWISRSIVEVHGGRLEAVPGAGEGTTLRFTLPIEGKGGQR
jgi:C4-dicarboxylate-specific signal transduction histidine kinase